jgi:putative hemolysin
LDDPPSPAPFLLPLLEQRALDQALLFVSLLLTVLSVLTGTALRAFRWSRLEKAVKGDRLPRVEGILRRERELLDSVLLMRVMSATCLVLVLASMLGGGESTLPSRDPARFFSLLGGVLLVFLVLVHGLMRGLALAAPERFLLVLLPFAESLRVVLHPLRWLWVGLVRAAQRALGVQERNGEEPGEEARDEILDKVSEGEHEGAIDDEEREMIESIIEFRDREVSEVMTPRTSVVSLSAETELGEAIRTIESSGHSRIPVWRDSIDNVIGILYAKDVLSPTRDEGGQLPPLDAVLREPQFIPETTKVMGLLRRLRSEKVHLAIVLDEYGGMSGLVTIEDVLEEIVGDIRDEYDQKEDQEGEPIVKREDGSTSLSAQLRIDELNEALSVEIPEEEGYDTLGGFLFSRMGRIPEVGDTFDLGSLHFEVEDADARRIKRVHLVMGE